MESDCSVHPFCISESALVLHLLFQNQRLLGPAIGIFFFLFEEVDDYSQRQWPHLRIRFVDF